MELRYSSPFVTTAPDGGQLHASADLSHESIPIPVGPQQRSVRLEEVTFSSPDGNRISIPYRPAHSLVTILTELSRLLK
jgi:hypothetical protein